MLHVFNCIMVEQQTKSFNFYESEMSMQGQKEEEYFRQRWTG